MLYNRLKIILIIGLIIPNLQSVTGQDFLDEFESLINEEKIELLPEKMIFTQKILWGENGILRKVGVSNLTLENREKELIVREKMLKAHQILGYVTFAGMIAQGILGGKLYQGKKNGDYREIKFWVLCMKYRNSLFLLSKLSMV